MASHNLLLVTKRWTTLMYNDIKYDLKKALLNYLYENEALTESNL